MVVLRFVAVTWVGMGDSMPAGTWTALRHHSADEGAPVVGGQPRWFPRKLRSGRTGSGLHMTWLRGELEALPAKLCTEKLLMLLLTDCGFGDVDDDDDDVVVMMLVDEGRIKWMGLDSVLSTMMGDDEDVVEKRSCDLSSSLVGP